MTSERSRRARGYPYEKPDHSFLLHRGDIIPLKRAEDVPPLEGRHPVIACGSNQSPERLRQKYRDDAAPVAVIRMELEGFDSVYSAHVATYGSIPATLHPAPGTTVSLSLTWLSDDQLTAMHATERENYHFCRLDRLVLTPEFGAPLRSAFAYISRWGAWAPSRNPIPLAAVSAANRRWAALDQDAALALARDRLAAGADLEAFIAGHVEDSETRQTRKAALQETTQTFVYEFTERLAIER